MTSLVPNNPHLAAKFTNQFIEDCHTLLVWGYRGALVNSCSKKNEPAITGLIVKAINEKMDSPERPNWVQFYFVRDEVYDNSEGREGNSRLKPDLLIETSSDQPRPRLFFEAKRLRKPLSKAFNKVKGYTGEEGMLCFVTGQYAKGYPGAGMLGYIQSDSLEYWTKQVRQKIEEQADTLGLINVQKQVRIVDEFETEWVTQHSRNDRSLLTMFHILLDFSA